LQRKGALPSAANAYPFSTPTWLKVWPFVRVADGAKELHQRLGLRASSFHKAVGGKGSVSRRLHWPRYAALVLAVTMPRNTTGP
jgi:hypothetical protein